VSARARDPDAVDGGEDDDAAANQGAPSLFWRVFAALCYLVPWIDSISLGREIYRRFRNLLVLYFVPGPLAKIYFSSQFAPLIIFFVMFLSIVKNKNLHHFVRFNCMQASAPPPCPPPPLPAAAPRLPHPTALTPPLSPTALTRVSLPQAIMLDIVVMLFHIVRAYLPAEVKWAAFAHFTDMFAWTCCMGTVVYAVFWTLRCATSLGFAANEG
jgi:hypothetical protein